MLESGLSGGIDVGQVGLLHQVFLERGGGDQGVKEVLAAFGVFGGVGLGSASGGHVVAPVFVNFTEDFEFFGEIHFVALDGGIVSGGGGGGDTVGGVPL